MRIWSIHPKYLDTKGLVALWRETLLAKYVLEGKTKGYKNHPQLIRFKNTDSPINSINIYLTSVYDEALTRNFKFDNSKFQKQKINTKITVNNMQIRHEFNHLLEKLKIRDIAKFKNIENIVQIEPHPMFIIIEGEIEEWEIIK